jgi:hypothetical protein|tara:strand:+ start:20545 stop:21405 length:861 start_codon:yes stop_codon:yes gene_type:complete
MAKKQIKVSPQADPGDEHKYEQVVVETPVMEKPVKPLRVEPKKEIINDWEIKDRIYLLKDGSSPLTYGVKSSKIFYFDKDKGHEREIQLTLNQNTPFVDEFKGEIRPGRIMFRNGTLHIPKSKVNFQKFMSIYHPRVNKLWYEVKPQVRAASHLEVLNEELDAMILARELSIDKVEAIMRVQNGSAVSKMTSKELKRDILIFAKSNPSLFLDLCADENIHLRNVGIKAVELGIIKLSHDQRTFTWASNGRKLMNVGFNEHPYSALAVWFKTDEGMEVLNMAEKQMK